MAPNPLISVRAVDDGSRRKIPMEVFPWAWVVYVTGYAGFIRGEAWILTMVVLGIVLFAATVGAILWNKLRPSRRKVHDVALDEGGLRHTHEGVARYYPRTKGLQATFDPTRSELAVFAFNRRFSGGVAGEENISAAKALCASLTRSNEEAALSIRTPFPEIFERGDRPLEQWSAAIRAAVEADSGSTVYRGAQGNRSELAVIFGERRYPVEARAAAGHALLSLDPTDRSVHDALGDATPVLVVAMLAAACPHDGELVRRFREVEGFLGPEDRKAVEERIETPRTRVGAREEPDETEDDDASASEEADRAERRAG